MPKQKNLHAAKGKAAHICPEFKVPVQNNNPQGSRKARSNHTCQTKTGKSTPHHLLLDSAPNLGPLRSRWEINKFENCWHRSVRILEILKLFSSIFEFVKFPTRYEWSNVWRPSNNRWSGGSHENDKSSIFYRCMARRGSNIWEQTSVLPILPTRWLIISHVTSLAARERDSLSPGEEKSREEIKPREIGRPEAALETCALFWSTCLVLPVKEKTSVRERSRKEK